MRKVRSRTPLVAAAAIPLLLILLSLDWEGTVGEILAEPGSSTVEMTQETERCVECHGDFTPGIVAHWERSTHRARGTGCYECHMAEEGEADVFDHMGFFISVIVTPKDCARCHGDIANEFAGSHHAKAGDILASLDNFLAERVEGSRVPFNPHSPTPGRQVDMVNGFASANLGCTQCHGSKVALLAVDGGKITVDDLQPDATGMPTNRAVVERIARNEDGAPIYHHDTWPNTGIGRINLDGSLGSCSACHSRHDFSRRRARQPENCGKCHLGPDHPQKEIYEESKHGVAYRDLREEMNLDSPSWVLGRDYSQAPTCATCHLSGNVANGGRITHDPGQRISWSNRPVISQVMDTDRDHRIVTATDPGERARLIADSAQDKRRRMMAVCTNCHSHTYVVSFYKQYDDFIILYNEKFGKPSQAIMDALRQEGLITATPFDEEVEWTFFYLWHHEGRRARHGASMMAPDYAHWHGMFEVAENFYQKLIPQVREVISHAAEEGKRQQAERVTSVVDEILSRPEHDWKGGGN